MFNIPKSLNTNIEKAVIKTNSVDILPNSSSGLNLTQSKYTEADPFPSTSKLTNGEIVVNQVVFLPHPGNKNSHSKRYPECEANQSKNDDHDNENSPNELEQRKGLKWKNSKTRASNIRKRNKNLGRSYKRTTGRIREERKPKNLQIVCQCSLKCSENVSDACKVILCKTFWEMGSIERQWDYIISHITRKQAARNRIKDSRRKFSQNYYFGVDGVNYRVCKRFFLQTLDISEKFVRISLEKSGRSRIGVASPDRRGKHTPGNKIS